MIATHGSKSPEAAQVILRQGVAGTLCGMRDWRTFYLKTVVPRLKARKAELGRAVPERTIAFDVMMATGQESSRSLISMWFLGTREPTLSQFMALCDRMGIDPLETISGRRSIEGALPHTGGRITLTHKTISHSKPRKIASRGSSSEPRSKR